MDCPHCNQPIPDAAVVKAAASIVGKRKRPGAIGLIRNPKGRKPKSFIEELDQFVDESINAMTPAQLRKFDRERKKIMAAVDARTGIKGKPKEETK